jgi:hypothetical protein
MYMNIYIIIIGMPEKCQKLKELILDILKGEGILDDHDLNDKEVGIYIHLFAYNCICMSVFICTYLYVYVYVYVYVYAYFCVYVYTREGRKAYSKS